MLDTSCVIVDDVEEFFAPMAADLIDGLIGQYQATRKRIEAMAEAMGAEERSSVLHYFIHGNVREQSITLPSTVSSLFSPEGAIAQLNADFWGRALKLTDVLDYMPQKRREEWYDQIQNPLGRGNNKHRGEKELPPLPEFEEDTVRATLADLMASRSKFFAERVDGAFRALSKEHVTNRPEGFSKRLILGYVINSWGSPEYRQVGYINDLRCVIAKFMGRDEPGHNATDPMIKAASRNPGKWMTIDGGAMRIRVYNGVGTAHLEVHPDMAWRLNAVLASLYPAAIPESFRRKPERKKRIKDFELFDRPLPFAVVNILAALEQASELVDSTSHRRDFDRKEIPNALQLPYRDFDKASIAEVERTIEALGGVKTQKAKAGHYYQFDYDPKDVIDQVVCSGCIPDQKSHQFYPTPERLARIVVDKASDGAVPDMNWLEPSAGTGGIADHVPEDAFLQCYEISDIHCKVLEAKGYGRAGRRAVKCLDFLKLAADYRGGGYDRVVCNPPYSEGRWLAHTEAAGKVLKKGGRLVAILPASAKGKDILPGFDCEWSQIYDNEFAGTGVSVVILRADKQ